MASNVIVEDESGNPITYKDVSTVSLDTEDGGTAVFVNANDIPEQVQADMAQTDATAVDFVKNQYFGVLPDILIAKEFTFKESPSDDRTYRAVDFALGQPIIIGQTYVVTWDDDEYELMAKDAADIETNLEGITIQSMPYLGNSSFVGYAFGATDWGEDTGEPFLIAPGSAGSADNCETNDLTVTTHVVGIRLADNKKKLDAQWLPDGLATEAFVEEKIAAIEIPEGGGGNGDGACLPEVTSADNGKVLGVVEGAWAKMDVPSGGSVSTETVILEDTKIPFDYGEASHEPIGLVAGETYKVIWDGVEYEDTARTVTDPSLGYAAIAIGNLSVIDETEAPTDHPFALGDVPDLSLSYYVAVSEGTLEKSEHTVSIYQKTPLFISWDSVTNKPFGEETVTIFEGTFQDTLIDDDGDGVNDQWSGNMFIEDTSDANLEVGKTYKVIWDGVEYECECYILAALGLPALGNAAFDEAFSNGTASSYEPVEPFIIVRDAVGSGSNGKHWGTVIFIEDPADITISGAYHCQIVLDEVNHLDNKYLDFMGAVPESQEFVAETKEISDLVTMGEVAAFCNTLPLSTEQYELWFHNRRSVTVRYDNVEYILEPQLIDPFGSGEYGIGVGNLEGFGGTGNGESFAMAGMYSQVVGSSAINYYILCASLVDTEPTEHTIAIDIQVEKAKIKTEYLPDDIGKRVSWNDLKDKPFGGDEIHIVVNIDDDVDPNISFVFSGDTFVKLTSETLSKDELIGATLQGTFPNGDVMSAIISESDIVAEYDDGLVYTVLGEIPAWICYKSGEHVVNISGAVLTVHVPEAGMYTAEAVAASLTSMEMHHNMVTHLDNKYVDFVDVQEPTTSAFMPEATATFNPNSLDGSQPYLHREQAPYEIVSAWASDWASVQVAWDGIEYTCKPQFYQGVKCAGNVGLMSGGADTGEPFLFLVAPAALFIEDTILVFDTKNPTTPILPSQSLTFSSVENTAYSSVTIDTLALVAGAKYGVYMDGEHRGLIATEYTSGDVSYVGLGNPSILGLGDSGGYDFFVYTATASDGTQSSAIVTTRGDTACWTCVVPTPDITHTIAIDMTSKEFAMLKKESLCDVPWDKISGKPFGSVPSGTVLSEGSINCDAQISGDIYYTIVDEFDIVVGATYVVEFEGTAYSVVASNNGGMPQLMYDVDGVFFAFLNDNQPGSTLIASTQGAHTYKVSAAEDIIKKIDAQYLPDDIGGGSSLPATSIDMTAFDSEGKIVETFADGTSKTTTVEFDDSGNPVKVTDGDGNVTVLSW